VTGAAGFGVALTAVLVMWSAAGADALALAAQACGGAWGIGRGLPAAAPVMQLPH